MHTPLTSHCQPRRWRAATLVAALTLSLLASMLLSAPPADAHRRDDRAEADRSSRDAHHDRDRRASHRERGRYHYERGDRDPDRRARHRDRDDRRTSGWKHERRDFRLASHGGDWDADLCLPNPYPGWPGPPEGSDRDDADDGSIDDGSSNDGSDDGSNNDGSDDGSGDDDSTGDDSEDESSGDDSSNDDDEDSEPDAGAPTEGKQALLDRREGFGRDAGTGAAQWEEVTVTSLAGSGAGSLRAALDSGQRWITFEEGLTGTIDLGSTLEVPSDVVIDGRGADITLSAGSSTNILSLYRVSNVVLTNLKLDGGNDGIQVFQGSSDIWIDHITAGGAADEVIGITGDGERPDRVTVSWSRFQDAGKVMLLAGDAQSADTAADRVTLHHNVYWQTFDRHPLVRFARVHAYNNWLYEWGSSGSGQGIRVGNDGEFRSESNIYDDAHGRPALVPEDLGTYGYAVSINDTTTGDPRLEERQPEQVFEPSYDYDADPADQSLRDTLEAQAGWQPAG